MKKELISYSKMHLCCEKRRAQESASHRMTERGDITVRPRMPPDWIQSGADPGFSKGGAKLTQWQMRRFLSWIFSVAYV